MTVTQQPVAACHTVETDLVRAVDGIEALPSVVSAHVGQCLLCQAELARYRKLRRSLRGLRSEVVFGQDDGLRDLLEALRPPATVHRLHRRARRRAYLSGIAAAATAGAAGALVIAARASGRAAPFF